MEAKQHPLSYIKGQTYFTIPFFQRSYVWDTDEWDELWSELISDKQSCFLGSIILKKDQRQSQDKITYKTVIDGQQRLTTLSILLKALFDSDDGKSPVDYDEDFLYYVETIKTPEGKKNYYHYKLINSRVDKEDYEAIIDGKYKDNYSTEIIDKEDDPKISSKILRCYKFFREKAINAACEELERINNKLLFDTSEILVIINLDVDENEQAIFDTVNRSGVKLSDSDIIKNALFQSILYNDGKIDKEIVQFYDETWKRYFENNRELLDDWLSTKVLGRIERTNIDRFLHCYAIIKKIFDPQKHKLDQLADVYKEFLSYKNKQEIKELIEDICKYSVLYKENFIGLDSLTPLSYNNQKTRILHIVNEMNMSTFDSFILYVLTEKGEDEQNEIFNKLERYLVRNMVTRNKTKIKNYNKENIDFIDNPALLDIRLNEPDQDDILVEEGLRSITNDKAKIILFWLELKRRQNPMSDGNGCPLTYNFQLEHIMPQSFEDNWGVDVVPVYDEQNNRVADEETAKKIRKKTIYQIGNMTLLTAKLNKTVSNSCFDEKKNGKTIKKKHVDGLIKYSSMSISTEFLALEEWNEKSIIERTNRLILEFKDAWPK